MYSIKINFKFSKPIFVDRGQCKATCKILLSELTAPWWSKIAKWPSALFLNLQGVREIQHKKEMKKFRACFNFLRIYFIRTLPIKYFVDLKMLLSITSVTTTDQFITQTETFSRIFGFLHSITIFPMITHKSDIERCSWTWKMKINQVKGSLFSKRIFQISASSKIT